MTNAPTRTRWLIVALLFGIYMLMVIDRVSISIAAKYIMPEYQLSEVQIGWIFSAFLLGYALCQIPGGWLGDRFGPRRVLAFVIFWWSFFTAVTAAKESLYGVERREFHAEAYSPY
jgi:ACS family glucarate transporter-like MFS transporter